MIRQHIKALNLRQLFELVKSGVALPPGELRMLRRLKHRAARLGRYRRRNASYPYSSKRQHARYARNGMDVQQRNSHKPGTLQPRHVFG
jgi:hypothetical protein